jgi:ketosteroid isomerase-like protein
MSDSRSHLEAYFATWSDQQPAAVAAFYAPDAVMEDPLLATPRRGRGEIERYFAEMFETFEDPEHELLDWAVRGARVWFEWTFDTGGRTRPRETKRGASIQTVRDGLIVHDHSFWSPNGR